ncbi:MAG: hypothetical protein ACE5E4_06005 [Candidatus Binatia bacterium]
MDFHELHKLTVSKLREMAHEYDDLRGVSGMRKDDLVKVLCAKLGVEMPHKVVVGVDKASIKARIRELKKIRDEALSTKDRHKLHNTRKQLHHLRHKLRKAIRVTA